MKTIKWIKDVLGKRIWMIAVLGCLQSVIAISGVVFALLMRTTIDSAVDGKLSGFLQSVAAMSIMILFQVVIRWVNRYVEDDTKAVMENQLRQRVFDGILRREYRVIKGYHTGDLMNRLTSDTAIIADGAVSLIPSLLSMAVRICGVLVVMYSIEPWIAIVFLVGGCFVAAVTMLPRKWQKRLHKGVQEADGQVRSFLQESLESLLVIHAFGCEKKIESESAEKMALHRHTRKKRSNVFNTLSTGFRLLIQVGYIFGFLWCGLGILEGRITYGTLTAVIQLIGQIQTPFASLGSTFPKYSSMVASAERLIEIVEEDDNGTSILRKITREGAYERLQAISFENVSFSYNQDRVVLMNETFVVNKGEFVAMIGSSGMGKSTIMKLLLSVYRPDEGEIKVQLQDETIDLDELPAGMFAYVPQGNYLMSGPIWKVVGFAEQSDQVDRKRVEEACKAACADEFIRQLPDGYDTVLGERGDGLSEGQMQRLAVARAVYSGCPILLLDEATSALDADTEARMISSLKGMADYTVFLVTHRKDVWELCDRVMERKE